MYHRANNPAFHAGVRAIAALSVDVILTRRDIEGLLRISEPTFYRRYYPKLKALRLHGGAIWRAVDVATVLNSEATP